MADLLRFTVPGKPEYVGAVRLAISSAANAAGFDVDDVEDIRIAVTEVCTNVFCSCEETANYQIVCELGENGIVISIDDGDIYGQREEMLHKCSEIPEHHLASPDAFDPTMCLLMLRALMDQVDIFDMLTSSHENDMLIRMIKNFNRT